MYVTCRLKDPAAAALLRGSAEVFVVYLLLLVGSERCPLVIGGRQADRGGQWARFSKGALMTIVCLDTLVDPTGNQIILQDHTFQGKQGRSLLRFGIAFHR